MQDSEELIKILLKARILEEIISKSIASFHSDPQLLAKLSKEIRPFIKLSQTFSSSSYVGNQTTVSDILLTTVIKQFTEVKKLIDTKPHNTLFFRPSLRSNLTQEEEKKLTSYLQAIREELNKFFNKNSNNKKLVIKSAPPGA
jgi:hypothetical protein